ncbi:hypothetical protein [Azospirillum soli]|uniref:hypothetical protein n=1 Tax=Azospirillum soli TaxID=1304799 RepID=UPI001AE247F1|nr:hypothetical protein [Azospirillum soli]MBP2312702.1 hypothetical protein [Azospirillum soli]
MANRYEIRPDYEGSGWTVFDTGTGHPVIFEGMQQVGLLRVEAENVAELLEHLGRLKKRRALRFFDPAPSLG